MKKSSVVALIVLFGLVIIAPTFVFAEELLPAPDMAAPVALVSFGLLGLVGGVAGYVWRQSLARTSRTTSKSERHPEA
jgi:hypothetical protein